MSAFADRLRQLERPVDLVELLNRSRDASEAVASARTVEINEFDNLAIRNT